MIASTTFAERAGQIAQLQQGLGMAVLMIATLPGCGTRGTIAVVDPPQVPRAHTARMIVATSRVPTAPPELHSGSRGFDNNFAGFAVSISRDRDPGTVRYPKAKPDPQSDLVVTDAHRLEGHRAFVSAINVPIYLLASADDKALRLPARIRGEENRVGSVPSTAELGGLDVTIIDLPDIQADDMAGHLMVWSSPERIAFVKKIRQKGVAIFEDDQKIGLVEEGAVLIQGATGVVLDLPVN